MSTGNTRFSGGQEQRATIETGNIKLFEHNPLAASLLTVTGADIGVRRLPPIAVLVAGICNVGLWLHIVDSETFVAAKE